MVQVNSAQDLANMTVEELADRAGNRKTADSEAILAKKRMAAFKMSLISPVIFSTHNERSAAAYFDRIAASPLLFPDGKMRTVSRKTLERWVRDFRKADKEDEGYGTDALMRKTRSDAGEVRCLRLVVMMEIVRCLSVVPNMKCSAIHRRLINEGVLAEGEISTDTIRRFIRNYDLRITAVIEERIRRSFVVDDYNILWETDTCYLIKINADGVLRWVYIQGIIDNHTRRHISLKCYMEDTAENFLITLRDALYRAGIPVSLYADNGAPYISEHTRMACANLGINLIHARAGDGAAKAAIERSWYSLQMDVIPNLLLDNCSTLEEIQKEVDRYKEYANAAFNRGVNGIPNERYKESIARRPVRYAKSEDWLDKCFLFTRDCHVYNDNTIRIENVYYRIPDEAVPYIRKGKGQTLTVTLDPQNIAQTITMTANGKEYRMPIDDRKQNARMKRNTGGRMAQLAEQKKAVEKQIISAAEKRAEERFAKKMAGVNPEVYPFRDESAARTELTMDYSQLVSRGENENE